MSHLSAWTRSLGCRPCGHRPQQPRGAAGHPRRAGNAGFLADALRRAVVAGEAAAARLIVVDALDEHAARFYERHGFVPAPQQSLRLYRRMKDVRVSLDAADS